MSIKSDVICETIDTHSDIETILESHGLDMETIEMARDEGMITAVEYEKADVAYDELYDALDRYIKVGLKLKHQQD